MFDDVQKFAQPAILQLVGRHAVLFVFPMRRDAQFRDFVHGAGADLDFDALALRADDARMQALVFVGLGCRDVIFETPGDNVIAAVDDAQRLVALFDRVHHDAKGHDVGQLFERHVLALHLLPDGIGLFFAAHDVGGDAGFGQHFLEFFLNLGRRVAAFASQEAEARQDAGARVGVQFRKSQIFQLMLHFLDADALCQRGVDVQRFAGDAAAFVRVFQVMQRPHIMRAIRQFDQKHANIFGHRQYELAEIFRLFGLIALQFDARQFRDAVHQPRHARPKQALNIVERREGVFDRIVQQRGRDGRRVHFHVGQNARDFQRMRKIGIAGRTQLRPMRLHRKNIGAV